MLFDECGVRRDPALAQDKLYPDMLGAGPPMCSRTGLGAWVRPLVGYGRAPDPDLRLSQAHPHGATAEPREVQFEFRLPERAPDRIVGP